MNDLAAERETVTEKLKTLSKKGRMLEQKLEESESDFSAYRRSKNEELKQSKEAAEKLRGDLGRANQHGCDQTKQLSEQYTADLKQRDENLEELRIERKRLETAATTHDKERQKLEAEANGLASSLGNVTIARSQAESRVKSLEREKCKVGELGRYARKGTAGFRAGSDRQTRFSSSTTDDING